VFTYADLDYLERRAQEVDPDYGVHFDASTTNVIVCSVTIRSVSRSATAGYFLPAEYDVWDSKKDQYVTRKMNAEVSHTIVTRAQAAAERRAFAMFGLGAELWASEHEVEQPQNSSGKTQPSGGGEFRAPTEARINFLGDLGVPESVAIRINSWSRGKDQDGKPISDVSTVINALLQARGRDKGPVGQRVWEKVVTEHAPYALSAGDNFDDEDDF